MGMGHLHLRKIIKKNTNWIEKNTEKHKHEYNIPYILKAINPNKKTSYYRILKCTECNSFKSVPSPGNVSGFIGFNINELNKEEKKLPIIIGYKKHEYLIGFYDIEKIEFKN